MRVLALALALAAASAVSALAQTVEIAPIVGYQSGGSVTEGAGEAGSIDGGLVYGGVADIAIDDHWKAEVLYSRQETHASLADFDLAVEHYMLGIEEEKGLGSARSFGVFRLGAARFKPALNGYGSETRFAAGLTLGIRAFFAKNVGLRLEGGVDVAVINSEGAVLCRGSGTCFFHVSGWGLWQGSATAGLFVGF
jgi:hypothetical protein